MEKKEMEKKEMNTAVLKVLKDLNIPPHIDGYDYLKEAVNKTIEDKNTLKDMMDAVYAQIAKQYGTAPSSVERNMRYAVQIAWEKANPATKKYIFGYIAENTKKPANRHFIAAIAEYIAAS